MIVAISPDRIERVWLDVAPMLEKALNKNPGDINLSDVRERIESGEYLILCAVDNDKILASFAVEMIIERRKTANIVLCGGEKMDDWLSEFMDTLKPLVKGQGCEAITIMGRAGWQRKMKPFGFSETARILEVQL